MNISTFSPHSPEGLSARLMPRPKRLTPGSARLSLPERPTVRLAPSKSDLNPALGALSRGMAELGTAPRPKEDDPATIVLSVAAGLDVGAEGYRLSIDDRGVTITGRDPAGLFYGVQTLLQWTALHMPAAADGGAGRSLPESLTGVVIEDWPDFSQCGVMLDISRDKVPTMETLAELVDLLAGWKINQLQLYTEHTFAYPGRGAGVRTPDMRRIAEEQYRPVLAAHRAGRYPGSRAVSGAVHRRRRAEPAADR